MCEARNPKFLERCRRGARTAIQNFGRICSFVTCEIFFTPSRGSGFTQSLAMCGPPHLKQPNLYRPSGRFTELVYLVLVEEVVDVGESEQSLPLSLLVAFVDPPGAECENQH